MGDPVRKSAKTSSVKQAHASRTLRRRPIRLDHACQLVDFAVSRLLALVMTIAIARGQVTAEMVAAIWAVYYLLGRKPLW
jgi:hypothetical protein